MIHLHLPSQHTRVYQCGECGVVWAVVQGRSDSCLWAMIAPCAECAGGSLLADPQDSEWESLLAALPPEQVRLEFQAWSKENAIQGW